MAVLREGSGGHGDLTLYTLNHGVDASSKSLSSDFYKTVHWSASGKVGIGTTSPAWKMTVAGGTGSGLFTTTDYAAGSAGSAVGVAAGASTGNTYGAIQTYSSGGTVGANLALNLVQLSVDILAIPLQC